MDDVIRLQKAAEVYNDRPPRYSVAECTYLYRNKSHDYFDTVFSASGGIMETYLKDASGDLRSPINGEICGLFFCASVKEGKPFPGSPFGDTRVLIRAEEVLKLTPNMFFADFCCMQHIKKKIHHVTVVLTKSESSADQFCNRCLPKLDINSNPFLYLYKAEDDSVTVWVSSAVFVDVFVTEDLNVKNMTERKVGEMKYNVRTIGEGKTSQGGEKCVKTNDCKHCDIFSDRLLADNRDSYEVY